MLHCLPELALGRPRIRIRQCVSVCRLSSVCVSVLTGIELCNQLTDFKANLGTGHCYSLVVISWKWKKSETPFILFRGRQKLPYWYSIPCPSRFSCTCCFPAKSRCINSVHCLAPVMGKVTRLYLFYAKPLADPSCYQPYVADPSCYQPCVPAGLWQTGRLQVCSLSKNFLLCFPFPPRVDPL